MVEAPSQPLFWLIPITDKADACLQLPSVRNYVEEIPGLGKEALVVSTENESSTQGCLLTFGKQGDIKLSGQNISGIHIQILLHHRTLEILIRDKSTSRSTTVCNNSDPGRLEFGPTDTRQIVIRPNDNVDIGAGGEHGKMYQFKTWWPAISHDMNALKNMDLRKRKYVSKRRNPELSVTPYETPLPAARYNLRPGSPENGPRWLHRKDPNLLGKGTFGEVYKTVNMHTGDHFAVKILRHNPRSYANETDWRKYVLKEVVNLERLCHKHVMEYRHHQFIKNISTTIEIPTTIEIFTALYDGSLDGLLLNEPFQRSNSRFLSSLWQQMLKALMYIANKGILHRDVKPENIMYVQESDRFPRFVLGDFGLSRDQIQARSLVGTSLYAAPEVSKSPQPQSHKVDVYSLGVTMLVVCDTDNILWPELRSLEDRQQRFDILLQREIVSKTIPPLLEPDPNSRPSAQELYLESWPDDSDARTLTPQEPATPAAVTKSTAFLSGAASAYPKCTSTRTGRTKMAQASAVRKSTSRHHTARSKNRGMSEKERIRAYLSQPGSKMSWTATQ